ncbi:MAG: lipoyl(octanoyl) transferase LipB [Candidatus Omnitrophica bacterium]|nr:lipoyl(octanoyl) transferase LipB [Candidatus Omnitrophota bacterium]
MKINFIDLGLRKFNEVQSIQEDFLKKRKDSLCGDVVLFSQFYPVITLGRNAKETDILVAKKTLEERGIDIYTLNRGGGVTLHLPGQWVIYPIWNLENWKKDISFYLKFLQNWVVDFLDCFKLKATVDRKLPGVWIGEKKISFIGIGISRWVTFHGLSININPDLKLFEYIIPCGIKNLKVTSLKEEIKNLSSEEVMKKNLLMALINLMRKERFSYEILPVSSLAGQTFLQYERI